jgi:hypothetical protein
MNMNKLKENYKTGRSGVDRAPCKETLNTSAQIYCPNGQTVRWGTPVVHCPPAYGNTCSEIIDLIISRTSRLSHARAPFQHRPSMHVAMGHPVTINLRLLLKPISGFF